jgi:hypothetical protein
MYEMKWYPADINTVFLKTHPSSAGGGGLRTKDGCGSGNPTAAEFYAKRFRTLVQDQPKDNAVDFGISSD